MSVSRFVRLFEQGELRDVEPRGAEFDDSQHPKHGVPGAATTRLDFDI